MSTETNKEKAAVGKAQAQNLMQTIEQTKPQEILELDLVKKRFIQNYNLCNPGNMGDVAYQRNVIFLRQRIAEDHNLAKADKMSLYKVIVTMGTKGVSIDPQDKEAYVYARGGKAVLELQAPAYVRRLLNAKLIVSASAAKLVYDGDDYYVENGKVHHKEYRKTNKIIAGYMKFTIDKEGTEKHINYWPEDWNEWRKKSPQANGANWKSEGDQPNAAFLKTKIVKHACLDSSWASGNTPPTADNFSDVVVDVDSEDYQVENTTSTEASKPDSIKSTETAKESVKIEQRPEIITPVEENFDAETKDDGKDSGVVVDDVEDNFE